MLSESANQNFIVIGVRLVESMVAYDTDILESWDSVPSVFFCVLLKALIFSFNSH